MASLQIALKFQDGFIECYRDDALVWRTPVASLMLIAEYTTNEGPHVADYFVQLWSLEEGELIRSCMTFYAAGRDDTFIALATQLSAPVSFELTGSTEWASRIMWPPELAGHPYFAFRELKPVKWREKLSHLFFGATQEYSLTEEVQAFLKERNSEACRRI